MRLTIFTSHQTLTDPPQQKNEHKLMHRFEKGFARFENTIKIVNKRWVPRVSVLYVRVFAHMAVYICCRLQAVDFVIYAN